MADSNSIISEYLSEIQNILQTGDAREHAYRGAFQKLIEESVDDVQVINEPAYTGGNAPDFLFKKSDTPIAYAECKDVTVDIASKDVQKQANRYVTAFGRILLTNYYDFEIISEIDSDETVKVSIATVEGSTITPMPENFEHFANLITDYLTPFPRTIKSAKKLAEIMASKARLLRDSSLASLDENKESDIFAQYTAFREILINDLSKEDFADMYAQTLVYGLFVARYHDPTLESFTRHEAQDLLPSTNPLLKKFFGHVAGTDYDPKISWLVDSLIEAYLSADVASIMHKEFATKQKDPVLHFYETFLTEYDSDLRKSRGVYYTPEPVVSFIVRSVDEMIKSKFDIAKGLADTQMISHTEKVQGSDGRTKDGVKQVTKDIHKVQILDPAVGTGTFLNETIYEIHKNFKGQEGIWSQYVKEHLLPRLHGFELMMASYTMAHLKLGVTLKELGYEGEERLSIWLTNSLEEGIHEVPNLFMSQWLTEESNEASKIKSDTPIMVVMGNPPYSGESFNKNYTGHDVYKVEPGGKQKLQERNSKWLNDDYVKFISLAEKQIAKTGEGIVSFITPHGYLDNPTFRGMRWHLMKTFDEIYVLDLHGNANKKEVTPSGDKDENVFGIKTGTAILFAIKNKESKNKLATVYHADFYGKQKDKYQQLDEHSWDSVKWQELAPNEPSLYFIPFDYEIKGEYDEGFSVEKLFPINSVGIVTSRDKFILDNDKGILENRLKDFLSLEAEKAKQKYDLRENKSWTVKSAQEHTFDESNLQKISYRPFDEKWAYYNDDFIERSRGKVMNNFIEDKNYGLVFVQRSPSKTPTSYFFMSSNIISNGYIRSDSVSIDSIAPLYVYNENGTKTPNLDEKIIKQFADGLGLEFCVDCRDALQCVSTDKSNCFTPENVLDYIYAVLHSPNYREKYKEFLKIDFPRVPYPQDKEVFWKLVEFGTQLRQLHLLESDEINNFNTTFPEGGTNTVEKGYPKYENGNVYINETQYFGNVGEIAYNFYIGGYQPAQKWLKDRRERELSIEDITHYQQMIVSLTKTDEIMGEIDKII